MIEITLLNGGRLPVVAPCVCIFVQLLDCRHNHFQLKTEAPTPKPMSGSLVLPDGISPRHKPKRKKKGDYREQPAYSFTLQFRFSRPINIDLWKSIKAPPGWKKLPTNREKQALYRGVRFRCENLTQALTPDEVSTLHIKLMLSLEEVF